MIFYHKVLLLLSTFFLFAGCSAIKNSQYDYYLSRKFEVAECLTNFSYINSISISGAAQFYKRGVDLVMQDANLQNMTLGDPLSAPLPIRFAEVAVYNATNDLVQCGATDDRGMLKALNGVSDLLIPQAAGVYTIRVLARTHKLLAKATGDIEMFIAVKQDIYTNEVHNISTTVISNGVDDITNANLTAKARQTESLAIEGGAFNVLNSLTTAYQFLQTNTPSTDTTCASQKLNVFWKPGFNARQYLFPSQDPPTVDSSSYYLKEEKSLYITGGKLGNISMETANHFDDFVIIHEFGHFLEDQCGKLSTPGGLHHLIARIDPRLAWTEGWANYFAAEVMNHKIADLNPEIITKLTNLNLAPAWTYFFASTGFNDTAQNIRNGSGFMFDFKKAGNNPDTWQVGDLLGQPFDRVNPMSYPGEGHVREGAVSRGLFKLSNICGGTCITASPISFEKIWKSMNSITGAGQSIFSFKDSQRVLESLKSLITNNGSVPANWTAYKTFNQAPTSEALHLYSDGAFTTGSGTTAINRWTPYGTFLFTRTSLACPGGLNYIEPRPDDPILTSSNSDPRYSNHYYTIDFSILNSPDLLTEIKVNFTKLVGTTTEFDLLLYQEDYFQAPDYSCSAPNNSGGCSVSWQPARGLNSSVVRSDRRAGVWFKSIRNLDQLDQSKRYLLNIRAYTANKSISTDTAYSYTLLDQTGTNNICP